MNKIAFLIGIAVILKTDGAVNFEVAVYDPSIQGSCECGAFKSKQLDIGVKPIISQMAFNTTCNYNGLESCIKFCKWLANMASENVNGAKIICQLLKRTDSVEVSVHVQVCKAGWVYSHWTSNLICCFEGNITSCHKIGPLELENMFHFFHVTILIVLILPTFILSMVLDYLIIRCFYNHIILM